MSKLTVTVSQNRPWSLIEREIEGKRERDRKRERERESANPCCLFHPPEPSPLWPFFVQSDIRLRQRGRYTRLKGLFLSLPQFLLYRGASIDRDTVNSSHVHLCTNTHTHPHRLAYTCTDMVSKCRRDAAGPLSSAVCCLLHWQSIYLQSIIRQT